MRRGRFITLEGGEGAGKSTQVTRLSDWLCGRGIATLTTREPGGSPAAEAMRGLLLSGKVEPFGADAEALFFAVARADHMDVTVRPALAEGWWVLCDRFMDSTLAYQGAAGVTRERLDRLNALAIGTDRPDLTIVLDLPPEIGLARSRSRGRPDDRFERDRLPVHEARRRAFLDIAAAEPGRCAVVDASGPEAEVAAAIRAIVAERLLGARLPG